MLTKSSRSKNPGFVLVLSMIVVALGVLMASIVINRVNAYRHMSRLWIDAQKARMIALSGVDVAISQLNVFVPQKKSADKSTAPGEKPKIQESNTDKEKKESSAGDVKKEKAEFLIKKLNRWQKFELNESADGLVGELKIYISSEEGKINLNKLYDFKKNKFVLPVPDKQVGGASIVFDEKKLFQFLGEKTKTIFKYSKNIAFGSLLESLFKKRGEPLEDISELLSLPEFASLANMLFVAPEREGAAALTDLFTVSAQTQLTPLLFSRTAQMLMDLNNPVESKPEKTTTEKIAQIIDAQTINWQSVWNTALSKLYAKEYAAISPEIKTLFESQFEPTVFSVVSYGKVGLATQKICAIIEKNNLDIDNKRQPFFITKFYWL